jgi:prepilin-type N-terminal cleavage/methylation domain-containing protein
MKLNQTSPARRSAFTLVEILLALGIFTILVAALYSTWILVIRATIVGKRTAAQLQRERVAMRAIEDSLTCIQSHQASIGYYLFNIQNGDQPLLNFTAYLPDTFPRTGEFEGSTPEGVPMDYRLRRLAFFIKQGQNGEKDLVLEQNPILMDLPPAEVNTPLILARNVNDFLIECWNTNTMEWDTTWDATNMLPPLVRVTLAFGDKNSGAGQIVTREISFPSGTMPTAVQTPNYNNPNGGGYNAFFNNNGQQGTPPVGGPGSFNPYTPGPNTQTQPSPGMGLPFGR